MRVLLVALIAALGATASAQAASAPSCSSAQARAAIKASKLRMKLLGPVQAVDPNSVDKVICHDFTRDGRPDMAVTIASGGTAGDIGWIVFRATPAGWSPVLRHGGYKVGLFRVGGDLVTSQPIYEKNDPNCCPTGGFAHDRYHWNGTRFVLRSSYHTKTYKP